MSFNVLITQEAQEDLRGIYSYITFQLLSFQSAKSQINRIQKAIESLSNFPMRYKIMENNLCKLREIRSMPCDNFLIFYGVNEKDTTVAIIRVLYGKKEVMSIFEDK